MSSGVDVYYEQHQRLAAPRGTRTDRGPLACSVAETRDDVLRYSIVIHFAAFPQLPIQVLHVCAKLNVLRVRVRSFEFYNNSSM